MYRWRMALGWQRHMAHGFWNGADTTTEIQYWPVYMPTLLATVPLLRRLVTIFWGPPFRRTEAEWRTAMATALLVCG